MPLTPFADGPGNTASGVAVYNNDLYLEALANAKEAAFSTWKPWLHLGGSWSGGGGNGTYLLSQGTTPTIAGAASSSMVAVWFDPADYLAGSRTTKLRIRSKIFAGSTSPNLASVTTAMYPITFTHAATVTAGLGSVVAGSAFASGNVVAGSMISNDQEFTAPGSAGWYAFTATMVTLAASSWLGVLLDVHYRQT